MTRRHGKVWASTLIGAGFGLAASRLRRIGTAALRGRGIEVQLNGGVGLGAVVRNQVPALIGIYVRLLFVEGLLVGDVAASPTSAGSRRAPSSPASDDS